MVIGQTYTVSGWVRLSTEAHCSFIISKNRRRRTSYAWGSKWHRQHKLDANSGSYTLTANGSLSELLVYVEGPASGVNVYLDDVSVYGQVPSPDATGTIDTTVRYQVLEGFGAAGAWYENWLTSNTQRETIYNLIFNDLGLDTYRIRNTHDYDSAYMTNTGTIVSEGLERNPNLKIMISSWSPRPT